MFDQTFKAFADLAKVPGAVVSEAVGFVGAIFGAAERVVKNGLAETIDATFSVFGRKIGVECKVYLLDAKKD